MSKFIFPLFFLLILFIMALINTYYIDDIGHHPLLPDNHEARLLQVIIELECEDAADRCQTAIASHQSMITSNHNFFLHIKAVWTGIGALWDDLKTFHKQIKKLHIITDTFTKWLPPFLYSNNTVHVNMTNGKEIKYKQIRRYTLVESKAYGFWDLYLNKLELANKEIERWKINWNLRIKKLNEKSM
eukprot:476093_1